MSESQRLQNLYIARLTSQERPCFVCSKFTSVVLTSADNSNADWFYICKSHLGDFNFCSKVGGSKIKSTSEIKKEVLANRPVESDSVVDLVSSIGTAWKSWRGKEDKKADETKTEDTIKKDDENTKTTDNTSTESITQDEKKQDTPPSSPQQPIRFIIQKDYFYLRQREYIKKLQTKQASEKLKTLQFPEVPKTKPTNKR